MSDKNKAHPNFEYFDDRMAELMEELCHQHWAELRVKLQVHNDIDVQLAELAVQLEVVLDGIYDRNDLCRVLGNRLREKRQGQTLIVVK